MGPNKYNDEQLRRGALHAWHEFASYERATADVFNLRHSRTTDDVVEANCRRTLMYVHRRALLDFLTKPAHKDDLVADHYVPDWNHGARCAEDVEYLQLSTDFINKHVLHISVDRVERHHAAPDPEASFFAMQRLWNSFLDGLTLARRDWFDNPLPRD